MLLAVFAAAAAEHCVAGLRHPPTGPLIGVVLLLPPLSPQDKAALESRCTQLESELRKSKRREEKLQVGGGGSC